MRLVVADEERKRERDRLTWEAWGQRLDRAAFEVREIRLRAHPWCREAMTTWLWTDEAGAVLSSCETFRMRSFLRGEEGSSFGIASVFTEERLRGRGHALAMIRAVAEEVRAREPGSHALLLFSEVGATLYGRLGFAPRFCHDRHLAAGAEAPAGARFLGEGEIATLLERFRRPASPFLVWPSFLQIDWHLERERIYAELLGRRRPFAAGCEVAGARAIWAADCKNDRLAVLLAEAPDAPAAAALLQAARHVAGEAGLATVLVWETPSLPLPAEAGRRVPRDDDALPMLLPLAPSLRPDAWREIPRALWV